MRLTKKQSKVLALCTVIGFFVIAFLFARSPGEQEVTQLANIEDSEISTTQLPAEDPSPAPSIATKQESEGEEESSNFSLQDFHRSEVKDGKTLWEVKGSNAKFFPEENSVHIEKGNLLFFNTKDDIVKLKAKRAILFLEGAGVKKAEAYDGVELIYNDDVTINTKEATFFIDQNLVEAPGFVTIESEALYIQGEELKADVAKKVATLHKNVESTIKPRG